MRKALPYFSTTRLDRRVFHVFADCPRGSRIRASDRISGQGPSDCCAYSLCELCQVLDDSADGWAGGF
ncbi:MAG: hypothetical protein FWE39_15440 [Nocardiaceae bacterium]|nr:hypothetical protein [Nocardiaceae bacterium]